jgi:arginine exporter protein ArgO
MYISEILEYLIWPGFIVLAWYGVKIALTAYEKKFPEKE